MSITYAVLENLPQTAKTFLSKIYIYIFLDPFLCNSVGPKTLDKDIFEDCKIRPCLMYMYFVHKYDIIHNPFGNFFFEWDTFII